MTCYENRLKIIKLCVVFVAIVIGACRESSPGATYECDLGTNEQALLPTSSVFKVSAISGGSSDWVEFRDIDEAAATQSQTPPVNTPAMGKTETEIRALIEEYNEVVAEGTVEDLVEYYVESQRNTVQPFLDIVLLVSQTCGELRSELIAKLPDQSEKIEQTLVDLGVSHGLSLQLVSVSDETDVSATGHMGSGALVPEYQFSLVDDEWYMQLPNISTLIAVKPLMDIGAANYTGWLSGLKNGQSTPENILQQFETAATVAKAIQQPSPSQNDTGNDDAASTTPVGNSP